MPSTFAAQLRHRVGKWIFPRLHAEPGEVHLHWRRVYILPTRAGLFYGLMLAILFIAAINYNLSLGFALTFLLATIALLDMVLAFRNLAHLHLASGRAHTAFAGQPAQFDLQLMNRRAYPRYALWLSFMPMEPTEPHYSPEQAVDIGPRAMQAVRLSITSVKRGWLRAPRVRLQTHFPLGLMRAWSYWQPDAAALIYPQPESNAPALPMAGEITDDGRGAAGHDDFAGIRAYQAGDSIKHLAWRQIARMDDGGAQQLVTKHFEGAASSQICLDFSTLPSQMDTEEKLSRLTSWVIEAEAIGLPYAFHLGQTVFACSNGMTHQHACLRALALYETN